MTSSRHLETVLSRSLETVKASTASGLTSSGVCVSDGRKMVLKTLK